MISDEDSSTKLTNAMVVQGWCDSLQVVLSTTIPWVVVCPCRYIPSGVLHQAMTLQLGVGNRDESGRSLGGSLGKFLKSNYACYLIIIVKYYLLKCSLRVLSGTNVASQV